MAPITQIGFTALSDEIISRLRTFWPRAARTRFQVPRTLLRTASRTCDSIMGTCLYAAAWKIDSTPCRCMTSDSRSASRILPSAVTSSSSGYLSRSSFSIRKRSLSA